MPLQINQIYNLLSGCDAPIPATESSLRKEIIERYVYWILSS